MFYHQNNYTTRVAGSIEKFVTCESCRGQWSYFMTRQAQGQASSPYGIGEHTAAKRSKYYARRTLDEILQSDCEIVPCPQCGWLQRNMRMKRRVQLFKILCFWTFIVLIVIAFAYPILAKSVIPYHPGAWMGSWYALAAIFLTISVWIFSHDLNATANKVGSQ